MTEIELRRHARVEKVKFRAMRDEKANSLIFLIHDLRIGGAERALLDYANHLQAVRPLVATVRPRLEFTDPLRPGIPLYDLSGSGSARRIEAANRRAGIRLPGAALLSFLRKARRLNVLATETGAGAVSTFLHKSHRIAMFTKLALNPTLRVIINVHAHMSQSLKYHEPRHDRPLLEWFVRNVFPEADLIVAVAASVKDDLVAEFGVPAERVVVAHNPLDIARLRRQAAEPVNEFDWPEPGSANLLAVGRLVDVKGYDLLLHALARLRRRREVRLLILGEGEARGALEVQLTELGLKGSVMLPGSRANPWKYMARADALVISSRTEAFPTVIGEALALGLPVLAADCSPGVREYLADGRYGVLVPPDDVGALARGIERLLSDEELRDRLAKAGPERAREFDLPRSLAKYESAIQRVLEDPRC